MSRTASRRLPSRPVPIALLLAALAVSVAVAPPARAGFGDLVKKAKDKAAQTVAGKATGTSPSSAARAAAPEFTDELIELTEPRVVQVLKGLDAGNKVLASRAPLVKKRDQLQNEAGSLVNQYGKAMDAAREKHDEAERCWDEALSEKKSERDEQMQKRMMSDPAMREKVMGLGLEMAQAQAAGDTATMSRIQREMAAMSGPTKEDSLAAKQKCGPVPPLHPMEPKVQGLQKDAAAVDEQIRANDQKSVQAQTEASGLTAEQFAMARERILMWLAAQRAKSNPGAFSDAELAAMAAHRPELEAALAAWSD